MMSGREKREGRKAWPLLASQSALAVVAGGRLRVRTTSVFKAAFAALAMVAGRMRRVRTTWLFLAAFAASAFFGGIPLIDASQPAPDPPPGMLQAVFAGGCFWSMEHVFDEIPGVQSVTAGYTGGTAPKPSYEQVELGITGHVESVRVIFDPTKVNYDALLTAYWHNTDPTEGAGQFCDFGPQYRPIIFYTGDAERQQAEASKQALEDSHRFKRLVTRILPASTFWIAEPYHQHFYKTHASAYERYRIGCGRDARLQQLWGR